MPTGPDPQQDRLLVLAPAGRDSNVVWQMLASGGLGCESDADGAKILAAIGDGDAGGAILTEEGLSLMSRDRLRAALEGQPPWSDFPFILLSRRGQAMRQSSRAIEELGNVTILERPLHPTTLVSSARSAIRSRRRQRLAQAYLRQREEAEAALRDLAATLEQKVAERTHELAQANDRLTAEIAERERAEAKLVQSQKMEAIGQLTGGIAHDFNNLLTAVVGSIDLLIRRTDDEKLLRLARNALQGAERGAQLTSQLLAFSRRQRLTPETVDANDVVKRMGDLLGRTLGSHIRLETRLDTRLWAALVDPTQLEMAILNLAINARDAMPSGGRLTIETANVSTIPERLANDIAAGAYVAVSVADTGNGMPPAVLARAFEPFYTTKGQGKGTGLGLSQVYGFARQSGGTVAIDSVEGQGTRVTIYLPRTQAVAAPAEPAAVHRLEGSPAHILLVDDDDDVRTVAAAILEELGYEVVAVGSGPAALDALGDRPFDLLLTDVVMPVMNGVELAERARERVPGLTILFASGYADVDTFGPNLRDEDVVRKPYRIAELAARVAAALEAAPRDTNVVSICK